ncbi:MAG: hypothetical protein V9G15_03370 [Dermatophilaceae bacterium]
MTSAGRPLLAETPEPVRSLADRSRDEWAHAAWLVADADLPGMPVEVAVPVIDASGTVSAALVVDLAGGYDDARLATVVANLTRAVNAAVRTLGHG